MGLFRKRTEPKPIPSIPFEETKLGKWSRVEGCTPVHFDEFTASGPWLLRCDNCFALIDGNHATEHKRKCTDETTA